MKSFVNEVPYYRCALFGLCIHIFKKKHNLHFKIYHLLGDMRHFSTAALFSDTRTYTYLLAPPGTMNCTHPQEQYPRDEYYSKLIKTEDRGKSSYC
jgi:hypothetical protein